MKGPKGGLTGDLMIKNSNTDYDFGWGSVPEQVPFLGENIVTEMIEGTLYISSTGLPAYGDPIKARFQNGVLYITTTGINP